MITLWVKQSNTGGRRSGPGYRTRLREGQVEPTAKTVCHHGNRVAGLAAALRCRPATEFGPVTGSRHRQHGEAAGHRNRMASTTHRRPICQGGAAVAEPNPKLDQEREARG